MQYTDFIVLYSSLINFNPDLKIYESLFYELEMLTELILPYKREFLSYRPLLIYNPLFHQLPYDYISNNTKYVLYSVLDSYLISHMSNNDNIYLNKIKLEWITARLSDWPYYSKLLYRKFTDT